jgi:protein TonB
MFLRLRGSFNPFGDEIKAEESALNRRTREYFSKTVDFSEVVRQKAERADTRIHYKKNLELSTVATLMVLLLSFQFLRNYDITYKTPDNPELNIEVADIPVTKQQKLPPPPVRPSLPVPSEDEAIPEDLTIASTDLDFSEIPPPPPPPEDDEDQIFVAYDEPPQIVGGMAALLKNLRYPKLAQSAGIEGTVFVKVLVSKDGRTERVEVLQSTSANVGFEEAAMSALQKVKWIPAKQRDMNIRVWVAMPVQFQLVSS